MDAVKSKQLQRQVYLKRLYDKGCDELHPCRILEVGRELGWDDAITDEIENFLEAERLVKFPAFGQVCITHLGQIEVETNVTDSNQLSAQLVSGTDPNMVDDGPNLEVASPQAQPKLKVVPIALFVLGIVVAIVSNIASSVLPSGFVPYLWLSWPLLIMLMIISILLLRRQ
jgi:hypothetical protein